VYKRTVIASAAIAFAAYVVSLALLFPGYVRPLAPHHSDLYIPAGLVAEPWVKMLPYPRPIAFVLLKLIGYFGVEGSIAVIIALVIAAVPLTVLLVERLTGRAPSLLAIAVYSLLLFAHPEFYFQHRHDALAAISYVIMLAAVLLWVGEKYRIAFVLLAALALTKETYMASALILLAGAARLTHRRLPVRQLAIGAAILVAALAYNVSRYHVYVSQSAEYDASVNPLAVASGFWFYVRHLFTPAAAVLAIALSFRQAAALFLLAGLAALVPQSTLPNHLIEEYAWVAAPLVFASVLTAPRPRVAAIAAGIVVASYWPLYHSPARDWQLTQEKIGRNVLASLPSVRTTPGRRVLVTGLASPFSPWADRNFVLGHLDNRREWTVITTRDGPVQRKPPVILTHPPRISPAAFDTVIEYDADGNLVSIGPSSPDSALVPAVKRISPRDDLRIGATYLEWAWPEAAEPYLRRALEASSGRNPYPYFFLGQAAEAQGDKPRAREMYQRALALEPHNAYFQQALRR
jgi:hypothetical protein